MRLRQGQGGRPTSQHQPGPSSLVQHRVPLLAIASAVDSHGTAEGAAASRRGCHARLARPSMPAPAPLFSRASTGRPAPHTRCLESVTDDPSLTRRTRQGSACPRRSGRPGRPTLSSGEVAGVSGSLMSALDVNHGGGKANYVFDGDHYLWRRVRSCSRLRRPSQGSERPKSPSEPTPTVTRVPSSTVLSTHRGGGRS
jgi:hypothetical protein